MDNQNYLVIMAGGIGSRFWPYSRNDHPKQFKDVLGTGYSLLQLTFQRYEGVVPAGNVYVVTSDQYADEVKKQLPELTDDQILTEPARRNTAPCIAYSCYKIYKKDPEARIVVAPSDHAIFKEEVFKDTIRKALEASAKGDNLITMGIKPNSPKTGYGYIQFMPDKQNGPLKKVKTFTEKPELDLAKKFLESGDFVWNSGIFIWSAKSIIEAFEKHMPDLSEAFEDGSQHFYTENEEGFIKKAYSQCRNISIDYGIMEKAENVYVILGAFGWSDLGSWKALHEIRDKDENGNVADGNTLLYDVDNCVIKGKEDKLIVVQGLKDYLIADCGNVLLVCEKDQEGKFREFVNDVKKEKGTEYL
ncbi:mannose-1-phosphate guanylyltransferase [Roseivirga sp. BDSF3-8]|uniref:mannose-1-phosphate guanylyltransferase n=1 Tax=Roseivirga sp. BDSF3-8 TaxID=3241598 RepID=UPI003531A7DB